MSRIIFLLEEYSMKALLDGLLPRLFPEIEFLCVPHDGKRDLQRSIPRKLRAWREPGARFVVVHDKNGSDCLELKSRLKETAREGGREDTLIRIACHELEAWYFGAPDVLASVFGRDDLRNLRSRAGFREADKISQPSKALSNLVTDFQKVSGARNMGRALTRDNTSKSFQIFLSGIGRLIAAEV
jgi:hypothetical protein